MTRNNLILNTDSYKASHYLQYPPNTTCVSSYIECRGGLYERGVFFGLQAFIKEYLTQPITQENINEAAEVFPAHGLPFNKAGWQHILEKHAGYLPLEIEAVKEGTIVPIHNVMLQIRNTDPACFWLTTYIETALLRAIWYPTTVATQSWHIKQTIKKYLQETADTLDGLPFKLHDFGARGTSSEESAELGGMAHLLNFKGTDTVSALVAARKYYAADMPAFSIPAAEHATMSAWGPENEAKAYANMVDQFAGDGKLFAVVSDTYDIMNAVDNIWGKTLKEKVQNCGGTLVVRPDSGDPVTMTTDVIASLIKSYGSTINSKGYHVLPDCIKVIQGDSVSSDIIAKILEAMKQNGQSVDNITFGMGGALLQKLDRDTMEFAMKVSAAKIDGKWRDVYKDPVSGHAKRSKPGRLALVCSEKGESETIRLETLGDRENLLVPVFRNGKLLYEVDFEEVRKNAQHVFD